MSLSPRYEAWLRRRRFRRTLAIGAAGTLVLGACGGAMLAQFTRSGMNDYYLYARPAQHAVAQSLPRPESAWAREFGQEFGPAEPIWSEARNRDYQPVRYEAP